MSEHEQHDTRRSARPWVLDEARRARWRFAFATVFAVFAAALATLGAWMMVPLGALLFPSESMVRTGAGPGGAFIERITVLFGSLTPGRVTLLIVTTYLVKNVFEYATRIITDTIAADVERSFRSRVWSALWHPTRLPTRTEERQRTGHMLLVDAREAAAGFALGPLRLVGDPVTAIGYLATMIWISPMIALCLFVTIPIGGLLVRRGLTSIAARAGERDSSRVRLGVRLAELLELGPVVRVHGAERWAESEVDRAEQTARKSVIAWAKRTRAVPAIAESIGATVGAFVVWLGLREVSVGTASGAEFLAFLTALFLLLPIIKRLAALGGDLRTAHAAWERLANVAHSTGELTKPPALTPSSLRYESAVFLDRVSVADVHGISLLREISFSAPQGAIVAIVGPTGSGKTLLLETIVGLVQPSSGSLSRNSTHVGYVPQDGWTIQGTVAENVRLGRPLSDDVVRAALDVAALPQIPLAYRLGERGSPLSGGERQRIALARAIAGAPDLLVLDEPTASLDVTAERRVIETLERLSGSTTIIVATHRSTLRSIADVVLVLRDGRVERVDLSESATLQTISNGGEYA